MKPDELPTNLHRLNKFDLHLVLFIVYWRVFRHRLRTLHPRQLILPATFVQILLFLFSGSHPVPYAIGNFILIAVAMFPSTLQRPLRLAHWIS